TVPDLIVLDSGSDSYSLLRGDGAGGFRNAESPLAFGTGVRPESIVAGRFNADPFLDMAVLNEDSATVSVFLGDGRGGFTEQPRLRSEERRVGKECRSRWARNPLKKKEKYTAREHTDNAH